MMPPLKGLKVFEAAARFESFSRAAEELNVTQSAVSHQVRNLEAFLEIELFERINGALKLTDAGLSLFKELNVAFRHIDQGIANLKASQEGRLIGVSLNPHFALRWLTPRLGAFWKLRPGFELRFVHDYDPADFSDPEIHLSVEWRHATDRDPNASLLIAGELTPACSPSILEGANAVRTPRDLEKHSLLHGRGQRAWREWLDLAGVPDLRPTYNEIYEDTNVRLQAAMEGEGVMLAFPALVADEIAAGRLVCPLDIRLTTFSYYVVTPRSRVENRNVRYFRQWLLSQSSPPSDRPGSDFGCRAQPAATSVRV